MATRMSTEKTGMRYAVSIIFISFIGTLLSVASAESGFCVYHYPDYYDGAYFDEYVFYAYTTGVSNYTFYDPDPSLLESEVCRISPVTTALEIGEGSLIAPAMVNECESVCDDLLNEVRSRISRAGCTYNAELSREHACDYARDRRIIRPPRPPRTSSESTGGGPAGPGDGDNEPGGPGSTGGDTTGVPESTIAPFTAFGPNNSTTLACGVGVGSSYTVGDNFCRGVCGELVVQTLLRLRPGVPPVSTHYGTLVALWSYAEAWNNCP